jgi:hypothetical protein
MYSEGRLLVHVLSVSKCKLDQKTSTRFLDLSINIRCFVLHKRELLHIIWYRVVLKTSSFQTKNDLLKRPDTYDLNFFVRTFEKLEVWCQNLWEGGVVNFLYLWTEIVLKFTLIFRQNICIGLNFSCINKVIKNVDFGLVVLWKYSKL